MSRIYGAVSPNGVFAPPPGAGALARWLPWREEYRCERLTEGGATLTWIGCSGGGAAGDARFSLVLDGRFYNTAELDAHLGGLRPPRSDAERLLRLVGRHGIRNTLPLLNGDFAIALYDRTEATLWLARDRFGLKPLCFSDGPDGALFASVPAALAGARGNPAPNIRFAAVFAGSHYRYIDNAEEETPFVGVRQVPRAGLVAIRAGTCETERWWSLEDAPDWTDPPETLAERYRELLLDSVRLRLAGARRPAFSLSGGLDSSTVVSCAALLTGAGQTAFSAVYRDPTYDERADIAPMLIDRVENWKPVAVDDVEVFALIGRMVRAHGEPVATATWLSHFQLCAAVREDDHGALFGGMGGDELNAGEYEYFPYFFADLLRAGRETDFDREVAAWIRHHDHPVFRKTRASALEAVRGLTDPGQPGRNLPDRRRMERYAGAVRRDGFDLKAFDPVTPHPFGSHLRNRTWQDMTLETAPCCLRAEDRHTTFWGLERIDPFYDHRLAEFMYRVPIDLQISGGVTKSMMRRATAGILPDETRLRIKKTGWNAPAHLWFAQGRDARFLDDLIASRRFRERGLYDVAAVKGLLQEHRAIVAEGLPRENHMMFFWQLINLELWMQAAEDGALEHEAAGAGACATSR